MNITNGFSMLYFGGLLQDGGSRCENHENLMKMTFRVSNNIMRTGIFMEFLDFDMIFERVNITTEFGMLYSRSLF